MDYNHHPDNMEIDGAAQLGFGVGTDNSGHHTSIAPDPQSVFLQQAESFDATSSAPSYQNQWNENGVMGLSGPSVIDSVILVPSTETAPTLSMPGHMQHLFHKYVVSSTDGTTPNSIRMEHAQALALAFLQHYYPESEGFIVQPNTLGPMARHGLNFMLKAPDGSDPAYTPLPPRKDQKKGKKKSTKSQLMAEYKRQVAHWWPFTTGVSWYAIEPEDIAGFEVLKKDTSRNDEYRPYTYLAIMIDDLHTFPNFAETNDVHRGDILTDLLSRSNLIGTGYGILLFGTRLEFYEFDNGEETKIDDDGSEEYVEGTVSIEEPVVALCKDANDEDLALDLRTAGLHMVELMFKAVLARDVGYLDEDVGGDEQVEEIAEENVQHATDNAMDAVEE